MNRIATLVFLAVFARSVWSQTSRDEIGQNANLAASNYLAYPSPVKTLTPAPTGKRPFYISHYGRHGSRYLIDSADYYATRDILADADRQGKLTYTGREVLRKVRMMCDESCNRYGELTPLGAQQHREIARRMYERFPEVFADSATIDAKSTVVIRCILSMENALMELKTLNPSLRIVHDASQHDMYYMNHADSLLISIRHSDATKAFTDRWNKEHINPTRVMSRLFNDDSYVRRNVNSRSLYSRLFSLAGILQNSELRRSFSLWDIFDSDDIYTLWQQHNIGWFCEFGPNELNGATQPYTQRQLLRRMVHEADSCIRLDMPGATLRFGHETMVLPLTCLLNINGYGNTMHPSSLEDSQWYNYRIFPMGCNIQIIFYRSNPNDTDVLVKVLLNEEEATLPLTPVSGPYYRWTDVRDYCLHKVDAYERQTHSAQTALRMSQQ